MSFYEITEYDRVSPGVAGNGGDKTIENIVPIVLKQ